jgi:purine-cytosine permease-like protein
VLNLSDKVQARTVMWIAGIASILVALVFPMERYQSFLYFIGAMFVPLFGVVLTDYFLLRKRRLNPAGDYGYGRGVNAVALGAWAAGFLTYELAEVLQLGTGGTLPSIALTSALYYVLMRRGGSSGSR